MQTFLTPFSYSATAKNEESQRKMLTFRVAGEGLPAVIRFGEALQQIPTLTSFARFFSFPLQFRKRVCVLLEKEKSRMLAHRDLL